MLVIESATAQSHRVHLQPARRLFGPSSADIIKANSYQFIMSIRFRLTLMNFMQFFLWGTWLTSLGGYMINVLHFSGGVVGGIYATMGLASLFMPGLLGIVADRWVNVERVYALCHLTGAALLSYSSTVKDPARMYVVMLLNAMVYMPTIALNNTISYAVLERNGFDIVKDFPPIRVWGTIGFICAMWVVDLSGWNTSPMQLCLGAGVALTLAIYALTMPKCPPGVHQKHATLASTLGLDAFVLFRKPRMVVFFIFAALLGAALQITNTYGEAFLEDFNGMAQFKNSFAVTHPGLLMSLSQVSETVFILTISFVLPRFGIKKVMLMSMFGWMFRFGLFGLGDPASGLWMLVLSMVVYGMAFDFFNISGSLFVEYEADEKIRASAQGLFMIMTNGVGAFLGATVSGMVVDHFTVNNTIDWPHTWLAFAAYALVLGIVFPFVFRYKHDPTRMNTD